MLEGCWEADAGGVSPGKQTPGGVCPKWEPSAAGRDLLPGAQMSAGLGWDPTGPGQRVQAELLPGGSPGQPSKAGKQYGRGRAHLAEPWPKGRSTRSPALVLQWVLLLPSLQSLQPARRVPGCSEHLTLLSLPRWWEMKSVLRVPSSVLCVPSFVLQVSSSVPPVPSSACAIICSVCAVICPACAIISHACAITLALLCWTQGSCCQER